MRTALPDCRHRAERLHLLAVRQLLTRCHCGCWRPRPRHVVLLRSTCAVLHYRFCRQGAADVWPLHSCEMMWRCIATCNRQACCGVHWSLRMRLPRSPRCAPAAQRSTRGRRVSTAVSRKACAVQRHRLSHHHALRRQGLKRLVRCSAKRAAAGVGPRCYGHCHAGEWPAGVHILQPGSGLRMVSCKLEMGRCWCNWRCVIITGEARQSPPAGSGGCTHQCHSLPWR